MPDTLSNRSVLTSPADFFGRFAHETGAVWLDSSLQAGDKGKNSIFARRPMGSLTLCGDEISSTFSTVLNSQKGIRDYLDLLSSLVEENSLIAVGFVSYEAMLPFVGMQPTRPQGEIPSACFFLYDKAVMFNHESNNYFAIRGTLDDTLAEIENLPERNYQPKIESPSDTILHTQIGDYLNRVSKIQQHITEGDIYQANLTARIDISSTANPFEVYLRLRKLNPAPYSSFVNAGAYKILSSSPERMFLRTGNRLTTGPIKGTIASGETEMARVDNRAKLLASQKDRAELLMIVDLLRNDLGRIARTGTVSVDRIFGTETYSSVIHLVADISCQLAPKNTTRNIFESLTPGGSITGAPKKRAVDIIQALETVDRSVYTGCIGYLSKDVADFNIAIRTMTHFDGTFRIHAGGGIVADSNPESENEELMLKAANLILAAGG